jgi:hypothetical protein
MPVRIAAALAIGLAVLPHGAAAQSLRGSPASLDRQNKQARQHDYSYLRTASDVQRFRDTGRLVKLPGNSNYELAAVSFPYARPEVKTFVERLASQYRAACGERLVVTSLTRPLTHQPRNASDRSVHPTGMALDLRVSKNPGCVRWLERTLLQLEARGVLDATRESRPPHFHVAVFPRPYVRYVASLERRQPAREPAFAYAGATSAAAAESGGAYRVRRGDTLWAIARRHGTTVEQIKQANDLSGTRIVAGQVLRLPDRGSL